MKRILIIVLLLNALGDSTSLSAPQRVHGHMSTSDPGDAAVGGEEASYDPGSDAGSLGALHPYLDADAAASRLSRALQFQTVSRGDGSVDTSAFAALHAHLEASFPMVHATLSRETVSGLSLLYTWTGSDPTLDPILLMAHQDVVPVDSDSDQDWTHPPFAGVIDGGYIWGRGALDNKQGVVGILEAVELLVRDGFVPERTVYLAFGHDEEVGGADGARRIAGLLQERGVRLFLVLDEGGFIVQRFMSRVRGAVAAVGIGEKGSVSLELSVRTNGGHSSVPDEETAIDIVTSATRRLQKKTFPARLSGVPARTLKGLSRAMPFPERVVLSNLWLFKPVVKGKLDASAETRWMLRTTSAVTMISGGTKSNVLPTSASAVVNFRTMPGESVESVVSSVRRRVKDPRVEIRPVGTQREAPSHSADTGLAFDVLARTIREVTPDQRTTVVPFLVPGGTDARYFAPLSDAVYRFSGIRVTKDEMKRFHGTDERLAVHEYGRAVKFCYRLILNAAGREGTLDFDPVHHQVASIGGVPE